MYYVYHIKLPDQPLEEGYVGVTSNLESRFKQHAEGDYLVGKAIRKHNLSFKDMYVIESFDEESKAYDLEAKLRPEIKMGWNLGIGGYGGVRPGCLTEEFRELQSKINSGENNGYYGKKHNKDIRNKISDTLMNKDKEWRISNASNAGKGNLGKTRTKQQKKNYSNAAANRPKYTCPHCGKTGVYNSMIAYHGDKCKNA